MRRLPVFGGNDVQVELNGEALEGLSRFYSRLVARAEERAIEAAQNSELEEWEVLPGDVVQEGGPADTGASEERERTDDKETHSSAPS